FYAYQPYNRRIYATLSNFYQIKLRKRLNVAIKNGFAFLAKTTIAQKQLGYLRGVSFDAPLFSFIAALACWLKRKRFVPFTKCSRIL
ncbi:MAG: hypothetical protein IKW64_05300, partial [Clostridia bacterium]|nr:hypothetical protein [Clostridia bacterium]